jgi:hypothetical protein
MPTLIVPPRFCGPPGTANGGYVSGLFAACLPSLSRIRLVRPVPIGRPLRIENRGAQHYELLDGEQSIALAEPATLTLAVPKPPDYLQAIEASRRYIGFAGHPFPNCFVCGPDRGHGDGLRIFAGAADGLVAAPWIPDLSVAEPDGKVTAAVMCAALDCPGYFAARSDEVPMLLGEFTAHIDRRVHADSPCVVVGWLMNVSGRKYEVGTALFDGNGQLCARAQALWIEPRAASRP